jgi:hypothetical protein
VSVYSSDAPPAVAADIAPVAKIEAPGASVTTEADWPLAMVISGAWTVEKLAEVEAVVAPSTGA